MKKITFLNQPKFSEHEADQARNDRKSNLVPKIEEYISNHKLFKDGEVTVSFAQEGLTSLVSIIETDGKKYVLKMALVAHSEKQEGTFLNVWKEDGVLVPDVIEEGALGRQSYILLSFVDADILDKAYSPEEMVSRKIFVELGFILSKMHTRNVKENGSLQDGHPDSWDFVSWYPKLVATRFAYIKKHSILNDEEHGSIEKAIDIIKRYIATDDRITYCHNAYAPYNAFATNPITIFDPTPAFNHPYIDLGLAVVLMVSAYDSEEVFPQLIEGYFGSKTIDPQVLHAFIVFNSHRRIPRWHMTNRPELIAQMQKYLKKNKGLLES